jgi:hypothetical protein
MGLGAPISSSKLDIIRPSIQIISPSIAALAIIIEPGKASTIAFAKSSFLLFPLPLWERVRVRGK